MHLFEGICRNPQPWPRRLSRQQIKEGLASGALVHYGFDNDTGGDTLWAQVQEAYPRAEAIERERPPAGAKDWNDVLRGQDRLQERIEDQRQERGHSPEHGRGAGGRERDDTPNRHH